MLTLSFGKDQTHSGVAIAGIVLLLILTSGIFWMSESSDMKGRIDRIHRRFVFADMHAHPSRFHRANLDRIEPEEIARYRQRNIDLVVCNISSDAAYQGGYTKRDGTQVARLRGNEEYDLRIDEAFTFTKDRLVRILKTIQDGDAALASNPSALLRAKKEGRMALMPALEGADGLEGKLENLRQLHRSGLRLLQLLHFRDNELGFNQTAPYLPGGLTPFGKEVVRECNRLGIIIDLAHSNTQTIMDALEISEHPVIFSHTGVKALHEGDRYLTDDEIRAIAAKGGVVGVWPNGSDLPRMEDMVRHIDHVKKLVGVDHIGIGSDLRGMSEYTEGFGEEANFEAIAEALLKQGYSDEEVGKIMGGNFFRLWQAVSKAK